MDQAELDDLAILPSDKVLRAIESGDIARALQLCERLAKEFVLMHVGLRKVIAVLLDDNIARFHREQTIIAGRVMEALDARHREGALALISEKDRQFLSLRDLCLEFETGSLAVVSRYYGEEQYRESSVLLDEKPVPSLSTRASNEITTRQAEGYGVSSDPRNRLADEYVPEIEARAARIRALLGQNEQLFRRQQAVTTEGIQASLTSGDFKQASALLQSKKKHHLDLHDVDIAFMAGSFSWVYVNYGDEALFECQYNVATGQKEGFAAWEKMSAEQLLPIIAALNAQHGHTKVRIVEDEHKYSLICDPCGTGGQMQRDGLYDPPISRYARVRKPQPMTFMLPDFPTYCTHCSIWNNLAPMDWSGLPQLINGSLMRKPEDPCILQVYKDRRFIPEEYYRSLGREKQGT